VQQPVADVELAQDSVEDAGTGRIILRVGKGVGYAARCAGAIGRLDYVFERGHKIFLRRFQRREVVGQRRSEPIIARRGGDGGRIEQRKRRRVELGNLEVVGAGCGPAECRLLHLVLQEIEGSVSSLRGIGLQRAVESALDARGGRRQLARVGVDGAIENALERDQGRGLLVLPEVLRDARHLAADRAAENVGEHRLLDRGHIDADAGNGLLVLR
jgi:hypothetical protein